MGEIFRIYILVLIAQIPSGSFTYQLVTILVVMRKEESSTKKTKFAGKLMSGTV